MHLLRTTPNPGGLVLGAATAAAATVMLASTAHAQSTLPRPQVTVESGTTYAGLHSAEWDQDFFLGIPYAQPPRRFTPAEPLAPAADSEGALLLRNATAYPPHCVGYGGDNIGYEMSEDCLYLNVVRPSSSSTTAEEQEGQEGEEEELLPVAVWIHGGGLVMGGSADRRYNLTFLVDNSVARGTPLMAVSLNYRLSAYGFLSGADAVYGSSATNIGFRDQRLALRWVRDNIARFGGDPDRVTIFGESSGAESVTAQVLGYGGDHEDTFRAAVGQSGFGTMLQRYVGGFNATAEQESAFDALAAAVCGGGNGTATTKRQQQQEDDDGGAAALECLRSAPFSAVNAALNSTSSPVASLPWPPVLDGDFFVDYNSAQLSRGEFARVPLLIGANSDEGTAFGSPGCDTDAEFKQLALETTTGAVMANDSAETKAYKEHVASTLAYLYPDVQSLGIPSLRSWPEVIDEETAGVEDLGLQYRRVNALYGDVSMQFARRMANQVWDREGLDSWAYRFDVTPNGQSPQISSTHFSEIAFVFSNLAGDGYATNPFAGQPDTYPELARAMSGAWIDFVVSLDPNGSPSSSSQPQGDYPTLGVQWPVYRSSDGGGVGQGIVFRTADDGQGSFIEMDDWRAGGMKWMADNVLPVFGF